MELVNREDNYTCQHPERITRHKRTMYENEQLPSIGTWGPIEYLNCEVVTLSAINETTVDTYLVVLASSYQA
jgi:hypothetical protein